MDDWQLDMDMLQRIIDALPVGVWIADTKGNLMYRRAARNFNPLIAMAADFVVAEVSEIVEAGKIDPDLVMTPGVVVDALILSGGK